MISLCIENILDVRDKQRLLIKQLKEEIKKDLDEDTYNLLKDKYFCKAQELDPSIPRITTHQFRHSHASYLISNNIPVHLIAERLGDTVEIVLKTYAHLFPETEKEIIDLLEKST